VALVAAATVAAVMSVSPQARASTTYQVSGADSQGLAIQGDWHVNHVIRFVPNGTSLNVVCQVNFGDQVDGRTQYGHAFTTWDELSDNTWVYDWYMNTPVVGTDGYSPGIPHCPWRSGNNTVIFIHGLNRTTSPFDSSSNGWDCWNDTWGHAIHFLSQSHEYMSQTKTWNMMDFRTVGYYSGDTNCGKYTSGSQTSYNPDIGTSGDGRSIEDLHNVAYTQHCNTYYPDGSSAADDGTNHESIYHLSCLFAWYLYLNFDHPGWTVQIVAHSMGGMITRNTIYQVMNHKASVMPPGLPQISDVVTMETPHDGADIANLCGLVVLQCHELTPGEPFINEMNAQAQNPQAPGGTDWTMMGSMGDGAVTWSEATSMNLGRKSVFACDSVTCYDHGGPLGDESTTYNATIDWCDECAQQPSVWNLWSAGAPHSLYHMAYALWRSDW
jgi:hypothetical protein